MQRLVKEDTLTESEVAFYIRQLLLTVEYMHAKNVVHLDLKVSTASYHTHPAPMVICMKPTHGSVTLKHSMVRV